MVLDSLDTRTRSFLLSLLVNLGIALICLIIFSFLRSRLTHVYECRQNTTWRNLYRCYIAPPMIPSGFFSWITTTYRLTDQEIYEMCGLDALMYIRFFGTISRLFLYTLIPAIAIALPVYFTANNMIRDPVNDQPGYIAYTRPDAFSQLSIANVENGSARMVVTLLFLWGFTILALYISLELWVTYMHYRHIYLATRQMHGHGMTLLVRNIPHTYKEDKIQTFFNSIWDKYVVNITLVHNYDYLHKLIERRNKEIATVEHAYWQMENDKQGRRPTTYTKFLCCQKMDKIHHHTHQINNLNHEIAQHQTYNTKLYPAAFVTLNSSVLINTLPRTILNDHIDHWHMKLAPDPDDVDYRALRYNSFARYIRYIIFTAFTIALIFFWTIPVAIASSFANLQGLADYVSWLHWIHDVPSGLINLVQAYLPSIILFLFLMLLPITLTWFAEQKGIAAFTWQQLSVVRAMFVFMVVNYFLVFTFAGSVINQLSAIIEAPLSLPATLGVAIPAQATAFVEIILFRGLLGFPVQALAIGNLIGAIQHRYMAKTPREQWNAIHPSDLLYGDSLPTHLFVLLLGFVYVNIHPLVTVFASVYFLLGYIIMKYQFVYMIVPKHESGGQHWPIIFTRYCTCLIVAQLTMIGLFGVKQSFTPMALSVPLPIITFIFWAYVLRVYGQTSYLLPIEHAMRIDRAHGLLDSDPKLFKNFDTIIPTSDHVAEEEKNQTQHIIQHNQHARKHVSIIERPGYGRREDMMEQDMEAAIGLEVSNIPCHVTSYVQYEKYISEATIPTSWAWSNRELDWENRYHIDVDPSDPSILPPTRRPSQTHSLGHDRHDMLHTRGDGSRDTSIMPHDIRERNMTYDERERNMTYHDDRERHDDVGRERNITYDEPERERHGDKERQRKMIQQDEKYVIRPVSPHVTWLDAQHQQPPSPRVRPIHGTYSQPQATAYSSDMIHDTTPPPVVQQRTPRDVIIEMQQ